MLSVQLIPSRFSTLIWGSWEAMDRLAAAEAMGELERFVSKLVSSWWAVVGSGKALAVLKDVRQAIRSSHRTRGRMAHLLAVLPTGTRTTAVRISLL